MSSNLWCAIDVGEKNVSRRPRARHSHLPASSQHDAMIFFSLPRRECRVQNPRRFGTRTSPNVSDDGDDVLKLRSSRVASRPHHNNKTAKRESGRNTKKFIHRTRDERSDKTRGAHRKTASALREFFDPSASCKDALFFMPPFSMSVISAGEKLTTTRVWGKMKIYFFFIFVSKGEEEDKGNETSTKSECENIGSNRVPPEWTKRVHV